MQRKRAIAIVGTGQEIEPVVSNARDLGRMVAENGWVLITGGRDAGVMRAASEGASQVSGSLSVGILPDRDTEIAGSVNVAIITGTGEARNNIIVLSADVVVACSVDDPGTASEVALALKNGKQVVLIGVTETAREYFSGIGKENIHVAGSPAEAIETLKRILR